MKRLLESHRKTQDFQERNVKYEYYIVAVDPCQQCYDHAYTNKRFRDICKAGYEPFQNWNFGRTHSVVFRREKEMCE